VSSYLTQSFSTSPRRSRRRFLMKMRRRLRRVRTRSPRSRKSMKMRTKRRRPRRLRKRLSPRRNSTRPSLSGPETPPRSPLRSMLLSTNPFPTTGKTTLRSSTSLLRVNLNSVLSFSFQSVHHLTFSRPRGPRTTSNSMSAVSSSLMIALI